jgi:hypothetical protein
LYWHRFWSFNFEIIFYTKLNFVYFLVFEFKRKERKLPNKEEKKENYG